MSLLLVEQRLQEVELDGALPKVLVFVHLEWTSCPVAGLSQLADRCLRTPVIVCERAISVFQSVLLETTKLLY